MDNKVRNNVGPGVLKMLGKKAAAQYINHGVPLTDAVVGTVKEADGSYTKEHLKRITEFANHAVWDHVFTQRHDKTAGFDIADATKVIQQIYQAGDRPSPIREEHSDYSRTPSESISKTSSVKVADLPEEIYPNEEEQRMLDEASLHPSLGVRAGASWGSPIGATIGALAGSSLGSRLGSLLGSQGALTGLTLGGPAGLILGAGLGSRVGGFMLGKRGIKKREAMEDEVRQKILDRIQTLQMQKTSAMTPEEKLRKAELYPEVGMESGRRAGGFAGGFLGSHAGAVGGMALGALLGKLLHSKIQPHLDALGHAVETATVSNNLEEMVRNIAGGVSTLPPALLGSVAGVLPGFVTGGLIGSHYGKHEGAKWLGTRGIQQGRRLREEAIQELMSQQEKQGSAPERTDTAKLPENKSRTDMKCGFDHKKQKCHKCGKAKCMCKESGCMKSASVDLLSLFQTENLDPVASYREYVDGMLKLGSDPRDIRNNLVMELRNELTMLRDTVEKTAMQHTSYGMRLVREAEQHLREDGTYTDIVQALSQIGPDPWVKYACADLIAPCMVSAGLMKNPGEGLFAKVASMQKKVPAVLVNPVNEEHPLVEAYLGMKKSAEVGFAAQNTIAQILPTYTRLVSSITKEATEVPSSMINRAGRFIGEGAQLVGHSLKDVGKQVASFAEEHPIAAAGTGLAAAFFGPDLVHRAKRKYHSTVQDLHSILRGDPGAQMLDPTTIYGNY